MAVHANPPGATENGKVGAPIKVSLEPMNYGSTRELFYDIRDFLAQHPALDDHAVQLLVYFIFAALFPEYAPIWPFVSIVALDTVASALLIQMLKSVFPQSLHLGELRTAGILSLPQLRSEILVIDQLKPTKELERVLRAMSRIGAYSFCKGALREISRIVVLCTGEPLCDPWLQNQAIHVALGPTREGLPKLDSEMLLENSRTLRAKLLQYRESNLAKVRKSQFFAPELSSPTREIAALLGGCIVEDRELQARVIALLLDQDKDLRVRRENSFQAIAVEAGLFLCHETQRTEARVGEFTTIANGILKGRGEIFELEPRAVGDILRSLGLFSQRLGAAGRGIRFSKTVRLKIHELAWALNVPSAKVRSDRCDLCAQTRTRYGATAKNGR